MIVVLQIGRVIAALLTVFWTLSLMGVFAYAFSNPARTEWWRVVLAIAAVLFIGWVYIALTKKVTQLKSLKKAAGS